MYSVNGELTKLGWPHPSNPQIPSDPKVPDNDPADQLGHGTHVAGILAGKTDS
jgi:subtilisin family serine protease